MSSANVPLISRSPPPLSRSTMSSPPSPRQNTIQALRDEAANDYKCRGCISRCLPCVDTPEKRIQQRLTEERNHEFQMAQTMRNDPDRIERERILLNLQQLKIRLQNLNHNPLDNEEQITLLNEEIRQLKEELELLKISMERKKLQKELRDKALAERHRTLLLSDIGGTINRKTRKYKKNNKKCKSKNRRSKYLKNIKRNRRTYKHRN